MMLKIGMIGSGYIAGVHAATINTHPGMQLAAVFSRSPERCVTFCASHGGEPFATLAGFLGADLDAVVIASSTDTHSDYLRAAGETGRPLYCEKPVDLSYDKARDIVAELTPLKMRVMMGFNRRFEPDYVGLRDAIAGGRIGTLQTVQMVSRGPRTLASLDYLRNSGGFFRDKGVHFFDLVRYLTAAEPVSVYAAGRAFDPTIASLADVDTAVVTISMSSGAICVIENARLTNYGYDERIELFGSAGMRETSRFHSPDGAMPHSNFEKLGRSFTQMMDTFARWIADPQVTVPDLHDGLRAQALAEAAAISLREERVVKMSEFAK